MKAMICEMCGGNNLIKEDGLFVCQNCGTKYTVEEARKLLGTVKIDKSDETKKLLVLARRARDENNSENAQKFYGLALQNDPNNWEASFFYVYYQAMQCKIIDIANAAFSVANNIISTMNIIADIQDESEKDLALETVIAYSSSIADMLANGALNHLKQYPTVEGSQECRKRIAAPVAIYEALEKTLKQFFSTYTVHLLTVQKAYNRYLIKHSNFLKASYYKKETKRLTAEIKSKDPTYSKPSSGCYVATAVYGSYDCPEVWTLRRYRDETLAKTWYGRVFIHTYYAISPTLVKWFGNTEWFKNMWKPKLDRMVSHLKNEGVSDKPYNDRKW